MNRKTVDLIIMLTYITSMIILCFCAFFTKSNIKNYIIIYLYGIFTTVLGIVTFIRKSGYRKFTHVTGKGAEFTGIIEMILGLLPFIYKFVFKM